MADQSSESVNEMDDRNNDSSERHELDDMTIMTAATPMIATTVTRLKLPYQANVGTNFNLFAAEINQMFIFHPKMYQLECECWQVTLNQIVSVLIGFALVE